MKPYFIILFIALFISCSEDEPILEDINYESIIMPCIYKENGEFIIESEDEFIQMATQNYIAGFGLGNDCVDTTQAPFSFNDYVLLGRYTKTDMNDIKSLKVFQNNILKKVIFSVDVDKIPGPEDNGGFGIIYSFGMNWVKIPKPADDYTIFIEYNEH